MSFLAGFLATNSRRRAQVESLIRDPATPSQIDVFSVEPLGFRMICRSPNAFALEPEVSGGMAKSAAGNVCSWDGRLDNRSDLLAWLGDRGLGLQDAGSIALALYEHEGVSGLHRLIGDWSLAIWDSAQQSVVLASDYAGIRPLYYHAEAGVVAWCSSLGALASSLQAQLLDEEYAASFLSWGGSAGHTPYRGILSVPPGSAVVARSKGIRTDAFWDLARIPTVSEVKTDLDYEECFRERFREAVAVRLNGSAVVCAELSGGLDSSSIVSVADQIMREHSVRARRLVTVSYRQNDSTDNYFAGIIEQTRAESPIHLDSEKCPPVTKSRFGRSAPLWWEERWTEVTRQMEAIGATTLLTGQLGDLVTGNWLNDSEQAADLLRQHRIREAWSEAYAWSRALREPFIGILWRGFRQLYLMPERHVVTRAGRGHTSLTRKSVSLADECAPPTFLAREVGPSRAKRLNGLSIWLAGRSLECPEPLHHLSCSHPYSHRPLVTLMLSTPAGVVCRPGQPRRLMRRALAGLVPRQVLGRRSKGSYEQAYLSSLRPLVPALLADVSHSILAEFGLVDPQSLELRLQRLMQGVDCNASQLRQIIILEHWLRRRLAPSEPTHLHRSLPQAALA